MALRPVQLHLRRLGATAVHLRMGEPSKAGPCISDNGNFLVDAQFGHIQDPASLDRKLKAIAGIVDTGLFVGMAERAYFGMDDGSVRVSDKLTETTSTKGG